MADRVSRRASAALVGLRAGAGPRIRAVGLDLAVARQAAFFPLAGAASPSSTSCMLRRSAWPRTVRVAAALGDGGQAIDPLDIVEFLGECIGREVVHAHADVGQKLMDECDGVRFTLQVVFYEFFCFAIPRAATDVANVEVVAEPFIDLFDSVPFTSGVVARQHLRRIDLLFRKVVPKNFRKFVESPENKLKFTTVAA